MTDFDGRNSTPERAAEEKDEQPIYPSPSDLLAWVIQHPACKTLQKHRRSWSTVMSDRIDGRHVVHTYTGGTMVQSLIRSVHFPAPPSETLWEPSPGFFFARRITFCSKRNRPLLAALWPILKNSNVRLVHTPQNRGRWEIEGWFHPGRIAGATLEQILSQLARRDAG